MVYFVGAGPGAVDLITIRGLQKLREADLVIYAGSLVNPELLAVCKPGCRICNSAVMTLEEVLAAMQEAESAGMMTVRLHTGDPSLYGAVREQMDRLDALHIPYESIPGVSSFCAAAAALNVEYTLPSVSQSVIITRMAGRTPVPAGEQLEALAEHHATMVLFLSAGMAAAVQEKLLAAGYRSDCGAAIVYKASWKDEETYTCTVGTLAETAAAHGIDSTALLIIGDVVNHQNYERSKLYDPAFSTGFREGRQE